LIDRFHEVAMVWEYSHNNIIVGNTVSNWWGGSRSSTTLRLHYSNCSLLYHNNFINVTWYWRFATIASYDNLWDNGCEGNYWDDYGGVDSNGDGIGDTPYYIPYIYPDDNYPLMNPYWSSADVNHDLNVDILDVVTITSAYATTPSSPEWNPHADIAEPYGIIDIFDVVTCTINYGKEYQ